MKKTPNTMRFTAKEYAKKIALLEQVWPDWILLPELRKGHTSINGIYLAYGLRQKADQIKLTQEAAKKELSSLEEDNYFEVVDGKRVPYDRFMKGLSPLKVRGLNDNMGIGAEVKQSSICWSGGVGQTLDKY